MYGSLLPPRPEPPPVAADRATRARARPVLLLCLVFAVAGVVRLQRARPGPRLDASASSARGAQSSSSARGAQSSSSARGAQSASSARGAQSSDDDDDDADDDGVLTKVITHDDLLNVTSVRHFVESQGVDVNTASLETLLKYVPRKMRVKLDAALVEGGIGSAALGGYVAFDMCYQDDASSGIVASYLVVMDLYGTIRQIHPTYHDGTMWRPLGLKLKSASELLVAAGDGTSLSGRRATYNWRNDTWSWIADRQTGDAHDIQVGASGDTLWQPDLDEYDYSTGDPISSAQIHDTMDINHVQLVEDDAVAIISSRMTSSIVKVETSDDAVRWTLGGEYGTVPIVDLDGTEYSAGSSVWSCQHNAEYFGDGEFMMFDNHAELSGDSRLLIIKYEDSTDDAATVEWEYLFDGKCPFFGDNDRLPTGNLLGCYWPETQYADDGESYDELAVEVVRDSKATAWRLEVVGAGCDGPTGSTCNRATGTGWTFYSIERFYTAPLLYAVGCTDGTVSWTCQNNFKQMNNEDGTYKISTASGGGADGGDDDLASGTFTFASYWQPADRSADAQLASGDYTLTIENEWGDTASVDFTCT